MACDNALAYNGHVNNNVAVAAAVVVVIVTLVNGREVNKAARQRGLGGKERAAKLHSASLVFAHVRLKWHVSDLRNP